MYRTNFDLNMYQGSTIHGISGKGKGKEIDFDTAFAQAFESMTPSQTATSATDEVTDGITGVEDALEAASLNGKDSETDFRK